MTQVGYDAQDEQKGYYHPEIGFNYRMTNMEAALGLAQLERLDEFIQKKKHFYEIYSQAFEEISNLRLQQSYDGSDSVWWLSSVTIDTQKVGLKIPEIQKKLKKSGVPTRRIFMPIVEFPPYFDDDVGKFTEAYRIYENGLNLPKRDCRYIKN